MSTRDFAITTTTKVSASLILIEYTILLALSAVTIFKTYQQKSFKFLKLMLWIMILASLISLGEGVGLLCMGLNEFRREHAMFYYSFISINGVIYTVGMYSIVWFVSFKYWETAR